MPDLIELSTFHSESGYLTVFEKLMPGTIKRAYYLYATNHIPCGGHRYHTTWNAMICLNGSCRIYVHDGETEALHTLDKPHQCLILEPRDWHAVEDFSDDAILLVLSNEYYSVEEYIDIPYPNSSVPPPPHNVLM